MYTHESFPQLLSSQLETLRLTTGCFVAVSFSTLVSPDATDAYLKKGRSANDRFRGNGGGGSGGYPGGGGGGGGGGPRRRMDMGSMRAARGAGGGQGHAHEC